MAVGFKFSTNIESSLEDFGKTNSKSGCSGLPIPYEIAGNMVDLIPSAWFSYSNYIKNGVFDKNAYIEDHRVLDLCCNSGVLLEHFYYRFMRSLKRVIADEDECEDFILKNLLYAFCLEARLVRVLRMRFYCSSRCRGHIYQYNFLEKIGLDSIRAKGVLENMKFDVVVGNPPYQNGNGGGSIYQDFACKMYELASSYMIIICPDRWNLSTQSNSFEKLRNYLITNKNLAKLIHIASNGGKTFVFGDTATKELTYFLADKNKKDDSCELVELSSTGSELNRGTIVLDDVLYYSVSFMSILNKIKKVCPKNLHSIVELVTYDELDSRQFNSSSDTPSSINPIKAYGSRNTIKYVNNSYFTHDYKALNKWKTLLARSGTASSVAEPNSIASRHLYMLRFDTQLEAVNCSKYCQTKLFRFLRVNSTAGMASSFDSFKNLPLLDFTKSWSDDDLNDYFDFSEDEISFINSFTH